MNDDDNQNLFTNASNVQPDVAYGFDVTDSMQLFNSARGLEKSKTINLDMKKD